MYGTHVVVYSIVPALEDGPETFDPVCRGSRVHVFSLAVDDSHVNVALQRIVSRELIGCHL